MIIINTVNSRRFSLNGIEYLKNYITTVRGNRVEVFNCYERADVLVQSALYTNFKVNGAVYASAAALQAALMDVTYSRLMEGSDVSFDQNNSGLKINLSRITQDDVVARIVEKVNTTSGFTVSQTQTPIILYGLKGYTYQTHDNGHLAFMPTARYNALFLGGKGIWGGGSTPITAEMLHLLPLESIVPDDITDDQESQIIALGEVANTAGFLQSANSEPRNFNDDGQSYYFSYSINNVLYFALFVGEPDEYGGVTGNNFTAEDFIAITDSEVTPGPVAPTLQEVLISGSSATITSDLVVNTTNATLQVKEDGDLFSGGTGTATLQYPVIDLGSGQTKTSHAPSDPTDVVNKTYLDNRLNTKADLVSGLVPASQLPGYVDDVLEYTSLAAFPTTGESGKLYIAVNTNLVYRWGGSGYVVTSSSLALGETSATAYRGDMGKTAYDHSQITTGNPHGTVVADISGLSTALNAKLTGSAATDNETQINSISSEDNKFVSRLKLFNWWVWIKSQAVAITGNWNFTGPLRKSGVDVATVTDIATKLNVAANTGLAGTGARIPKVSENGTITVDAFLRWAAETNELIVGSATSPGRINVVSEIFELAVQDNIISGQSRILFNSAQDNALSFVDKSGKVYMTFRSTTGDTGVVLKQREVFDEQVFYPLSRRQAAVTSAGAGVKVYATDSLGNAIAIPFTVDTTILFVEATLVVKNNTASQVVCAKLKAIVKKVSGTVIITTAPIEIISNNPTYTGFAAGIELVGSNLQFYFTPATEDTIAYTGAFTEIKYTIN